MGTEKPEANESADKSEANETADKSETNEEKGGEVAAGKDKLNDEDDSATAAFAYIGAMAIATAALAF